MPYPARFLQVWARFSKITQVQARKLYIPFLSSTMQEIAEKPKKFRKTTEPYCPILLRAIFSTGYRVVYIGLSGCRGNSGIFCYFLHRTAEEGDIQLSRLNLPDLAKSCKNRAGQGIEVSCLNLRVRVRLNLRLNLRKLAKYGSWKIIFFLHQ